MFFEETHIRWTRRFEDFPSHVISICIKVSKGRQIGDIPKKLRNFVTIASASSSACCVPTGKCSEITEIKSSALCGFPSLLRSAVNANFKLRAFHATSDSMDGVRSSFTFSLELMRRTSYTTAFVGSLGVDTKE